MPSKANMNPNVKSNKFTVVNNTNTPALGPFWVVSVNTTGFPAQARVFSNPATGIGRSELVDQNQTQPTTATKQKEGCGNQEFPMRRCLALLPSGRAWDHGQIGSLSQQSSPFSFDALLRSLSI